MLEITTILNGVKYRYDEYASCEFNFDCHKHGCPFERYDDCGGWVKVEEPNATQAVKKLAQVMNDLKWVE